MADRLPVEQKRRLTCAAQYVRMSTDHQKYSTENQAAAIAIYAAQRNLTIVRTYSDRGRSGLSIGGRDALKQLIADVQSGGADFGAILVYDVSRWGRFQDVDESAYYEFICKEAGIRVLYCAEQFENDGSLASAILKNMKRAMAGEFSRELSTKVFAGQCRGAGLGFWQGGPAGYGLRRQLVDEHGIPKAQMEAGQHKSFQTDRVILRPGPRSEVRTVRRIFNDFVVRRKSRTEIAAELNANNITTTRGNRWNVFSVHKLLTNEKYIGHNVFNRGSFKLSKQHVLNPPDTWIRRDNAFKGIVSAEVFAKAQTIIARQQRRLSDQQALDRLASLWRRKGHLTDKIIVAAKGVPHTSTYIKRFGSLLAAYRLIGFQPKPRYRHADTTAKINGIIRSVVDKVLISIESRGGSAAFSNETGLLAIDGEKTNVSFRVAWSVGDGAGRARRWRVRAARRARADLALLIRMTTSNARIMDYYLVPTVSLPKDGKLRKASRCFAETQRHDRLDSICRMWTPASKRALRMPPRCN
jgi:DNA invertase Pin-like site-specific DNA recombinase